MASDVARFITWPDPRLTQAASARPVDDGLRDIGSALLRAAEEVQAYGLAAAHIGLVAPVAVLSVSDAAAREYRVIYNPRSVATYGPDAAGKEGSVSMPGIEVDVIRPHAARIACDDEAGNAVELELTGFAARVALHEIDQVNGIFFLNRISRLKREAAIKRFSKLSRRMG